MYVLAFQLFVCPYELAEMILFLINRTELIFCRLFIELCTDTSLGFLIPGGSAGRYGY
jgi:hypothetical protein